VETTKLKEQKKYFTFLYWTNKHIYEQYVGKTRKSSKVDMQIIVKM